MAMRLFLGRCRGAGVGAVAAASGASEQREKGESGWTGHGSSLSESLALTAAPGPTASAT